MKSKVHKISLNLPELNVAIREYVSKLDHRIPVWGDMTKRFEECNGEIVGVNLEFVDTPEED